MNYTFDTSEEFVLRHGDTAIPVELSDGKAVIYRIAEGAFLDWLVKHGDDPFSADSKSYLGDALTAVMDRRGFIPAAPLGNTLLCYRYTPAGSPVPQNVKEGSEVSEDGIVILRSAEDAAKYKLADSSWKLSPDADDKRDVACCRVTDGQIAAAAELNDISDDGYPEICVECAPEYRGRGYASACVSAIAEYLTGVCGEPAVSFVCEMCNAPSRRVAEKAGFKLASRRVPFVFYRKSE